MNGTFRRLLILLILASTSGSGALGNDQQLASQVHPLSILPFLLLLLAIAIAPFINRHWWEARYPLVAIGLGASTSLYYFFWLHQPERMIHTAIEYFSFISLIGSLFVVAGGIHIRIRGKSKPLANVYLLAIGAVLANIVGTTGASMILIRPYLRVNKYRIRPYHVVFFIFIVSNMGGALTPIGDPPLFLGYLRGIPFFWVAENVWGKWALAMAFILAVFFVIDWYSFRKLSSEIRHSAEEARESGEASGVHNVFYLSIILVAVFITDPPFVREALMILAAVGSYFTTKKEIHQKNDFNFLPLKEVSILFLGIFATMVPALDWLSANAESLGLRTPGHFYWITGVLSSFLDNAPTYLNFFSAAGGLFVSDATIVQIRDMVQRHGINIMQYAHTTTPEIRSTIAALLHYQLDMVTAGHIPDNHIRSTYLIANHGIYVQALSLAAVFFGAMTYIGNGPNFMVKSIAEQNGVQVPTFFGYFFKYAIPILLTIFAGIWFLFFW